MERSIRCRKLHLRGSERGTASRRLERVFLCEIKREDSKESDRGNLSSKRGNASREKEKRTQHRPSLKEVVERGGITASTSEC